MATLATQQAFNTQAIANTQQEIDQLARRQDNTRQLLDDLISTANGVFARDTILNDVLMELQDTQEAHQRNFEEHQKLPMLLYKALRGYCCN
ncbi:MULTISPECIES: hypothetical protein [unclassified Tolypothrix]|uniref:hypothetical protein n=1 Tax=unclassified Tolypothrix TaxID=2649714 RepID=UPI0005EAC008|nr:MULTISPECIES: hypothetical protein [unclassified Tolypothrix]EKF05657.1 hypothetical protein FDUTEX481_00512 [Tolypothrix sp. PCC 7601]BAY92579.1 hypothetical protein NIES3275_46150 [Microchaete diplosiphon NIES-3275]